MEEEKSTFQKDDGTVSWEWQPFTKFNTRYRRVTHIAVELDDTGASGDPVKVEWVENGFSIQVASLDLNNRTFRAFEFDTPLLIRDGESLKITFANGNDRAVKMKIFSHV